MTPCREAAILRSAGSEFVITEEGALYFRRGGVWEQVPADGEIRQTEIYEDAGSVEVFADGGRAVFSFMKD